MTDQAVGEFESVWEAAGSRIAGVLDGASAVVVLGHDPIATAAVALGIARVQATHRRVAVGDLIGDVAPLHDLVTDDDPHGITDSFQYGVSLNKIARQIDTAGNLHVLPTGSEPIVTEDILRSDRWRRLGSGFHEVGALLVLVAPAAIPGVDALADHLDGVVLVGGAANPSPNARVFAEVSSPARRAAARPAPRQSAAEPTETGRRRWIAPLVGVGALAVIAAVAGRWYLSQPRSQPRTVAARDTTASSGSLAGGATGAVVVDSSPPLSPANPADSAIASPFAVQIAMVDTEDGAAMRIRAGGVHFPVATYAAVSRGSDRGTWYKVVTGAYATRTRADTLLAFIRRNRAVPQGWGTVIRAPLALQVATAPSATEAAAIIADLQSKKVPVYGLMQADNTVRIYAGAFETPDEAALYKSELKTTKNIDATLVYRVGRAY